MREQIRYKSRREIEKLREAGRLAANALRVAARAAKPGATLLELDKLAETYIRKNGGTPNFKGYHGFPGTLCTSVNDRVVHGIPSSYALQEGDIIAIDCGAKLDGYHGDTCLTVGVGRISEQARDPARDLPAGHVPRHRILPGGLPAGGHVHGSAALCRGSRLFGGP